MHKRRDFIRKGLQVMAAAGTLPGMSGQLRAEEGDMLHPPPKIDWEKIADLPPRRGFEVQPGLAGAFAGVHGDVLIIAGGTNFPQGYPWTGGQRAWWADI